MVVHITSLLWLLFVLNALQHFSFAQAHHQDNKFVGAQGSVVSAQKEVVDRFITTRKYGFGGRKMIVDEVVMGKENDEKELKDLTEGTSKKFSGKEENNALVKPLQGSQGQYLNYHQKNMNNLKAKTEKSASLGNPRSETVHNSNKNPNQDSKKLPTKARLDTLSTSDTTLISPPPHDQFEAQRLVEATKEIVNLMNKDYKGMDRPRRKPPINNNAPLH